MGDRANLVIELEPDQPRLYLYTHWTGATLPAALQSGLSKRERWDDPSYLARILFDALCPERGGTTGFGIDVRMRDNERDVLLVNVFLRRVELHAFERVRFRVAGGFREPVKTWTFAEFVELPDVSWQALSAGTSLEQRE